MLANAIFFHFCSSEYRIRQHWANRTTKKVPSVGPRADPGVQAVSPQMTISHPHGSRLPLHSARPAVTFPAAEHHRPLASTKLYCLVTDAHRCEQLAQGCYAAFAPSRIWTHDLLIASPTLYPLPHRIRSYNYIHVDTHHGSDIHGASNSQVILPTNR